MNFKTLSLKLAGGLLALTVGITAMAGHASRASADPLFCAPNCPQIDIRADLVAQNLNAVKQADGKLYVSFQIKNQGLTDAHSFQGQIMVNGVVVRTFSWVLVAAGNTVGESSMNIPLPAGTKLANVQINLDTTHVVPESNEGNNTLVKSFFF